MANLLAFLNFSDENIIFKFRSGFGYISIYPELYVLLYAFHSHSFKL